MKFHIARSNGFKINHVFGLIDFISPFARSAGNAAHSDV